MKVVGYVDGMNFYELSKSKEWYPSGWCNWRDTIAAYCPRASSVEIRYFTTPLREGTQSRHQRQKLHLLAMEEVAGAKLIYGRQASRPLRCTTCGQRFSCQGCGSEHRTVEKETDVNIALHLFKDALMEKFDLAYLVSGDSDLLPAVDFSLFNNKTASIVILRPPDGWNSDSGDELLRKYGARIAIRDLDPSRLVRFSDDLPKRWGMTLPAHWRSAAGKRPSNVGTVSKTPARGGDRRR